MDTAAGRRATAVAHSLVIGSRRLVTGKRRAQIQRWTLIATPSRGGAGRREAIETSVDRPAESGRCACKPLESRRREGRASSRQAVTNRSGSSAAAREPRTRGAQPPDCGCSAR